MQLYIYVIDAKIEKIIVGDNSETFLNKLDAANYYANFIGKDVGSLDAFATDAVSGATKSSDAVRNAVDVVVQYYEENVAGGQS